MSPHLHEAALRYARGPGVKSQSAVRQSAVPDRRQHLGGQVSSKRELREAIRQWAEITFAISRQRDEARAERDDIRDQLAQAIAERDEVVSELSRTLRELAQARADLDADLVEVPIQHTTPEPRPFRVGDRVRVAEGATKKGLFDGQPMKSLVQGMSGEVVRIHTDGDLYVYTDGPCGYVSPEFCTLIEPELEPDDDAPTPQPITLTLPDGTTVTFDAVVTR